MLLRSYRYADCDEFAKLFYDTVHEVNIRDCTAEQVSAWADDGNIDPAAWDKSFSEHYTVVAEENGVISSVSATLLRAVISIACMFTRIISVKALRLRYATGWKAFTTRTS